MIKNTISIEEINKIFGNYNEKYTYLNELYRIKGINELIPKIKKKIDIKIMDTWDFEISNSIIRNIFKTTDKYKVGKFSEDSLKEMITEWNKLKLGELDWPFRAMSFDQHIQSINTKTELTELEKDEIVKKEVVKYRRIKKINTARNDFIEYLIVSNNKNITPTLKHRRGVDFYINGYPYDQKVSRSVTKNFIEDYGENYKEFAINNPDIVCKYLYKYQDEQRFGAEPRLLIVYLDEDLNEEDIYKCVTSVNFNKPINISFSYNHSSGETINYNVNCYIILLYRKI